MGRVRPAKGVERGDRRTWRVADNLDHLPVATAELDAVEAFLTPLVKALLGEDAAVNSRLNITSVACAKPASGSSASRRTSATIQ